VKQPTALSLLSKQVSGESGRIKERGCRPSEVKGLRFAPIPSGLSPLTSFTPLFTKAIIGLSAKALLTIFSYVGTCFQKPKPEKQYLYLHKREHFIREREKDYEP
jgi:hypothetical protein